MNYCGGEGVCVCVGGGGGVCGLKARFTECQPSTSASIVVERYIFVRSARRSSNSSMNRYVKLHFC